jgi:hypothetical protein
VYFGPETLLVAADVAFRTPLTTEEMDTAITEIEDALVAANPDVGKVYVEPE